MKRTYLNIFVVLVAVIAASRILFSVVILKDNLSVRQLIGLGIVLIGLFLLRC